MTTQTNIIIYISLFQFIIALVDHTLSGSLNILVVVGDNTLFND